MLGYSCNHCGEFISQSKPRERRNCPTCGCPSAYTVPFDRGMLPLLRALADDERMAGER